MAARRAGRIERVHDVCGVTEVPEPCGTGSSRNGLGCSFTAGGTGWPTSNGTTDEDDPPQLQSLGTAHPQSPTVPTSQQLSYAPVTHPPQVPQPPQA